MNISKVSLCKCEDYWMSSFETIKNVLTAHRHILKSRFKVKDIGVFGSVARNEETEISDVDILVEFNEAVGWEFFDLKDYLEEITGRQVDLVTKKALKPQMKDAIIGEVRMV
mgnify:CR=1 FL=1